MGELHKLVPVEVGERYRFCHDGLLDVAKGEDFGRLATIGNLPDGTIRVSGSATCNGLSASTTRS